MTPSEHTEADAPARPPASLRLVVYAVAALALLVVAWSLIEGGNRDLGTAPSALLTPSVAAWFR